VWINSHGSIDAGVPFGGWKQSGIGVVGGKEGIIDPMYYLSCNCYMVGIYLRARL
jgi:acyl-CoA reductase-like NAD-dependent aldehyde dehydrogenase